MGGIQSGAHNLGDALWVQERQKQKCYRDSNRHEGNGAQNNGNSISQSQSSTQERRKLLKRTRSLAVISEDESRAPSSEPRLLGSSTCDSSSTPSPFDSSSPTQHHRRAQLIPRAKLIDRNSLKDRLSKSQQHLSDCYERLNEASSSSRPCHSRSTCGLYSSLPPPLATLPDPLAYARSATYRQPSDRLNILKWPESPRRYRSVQDLNSVSALVDIVEDNYWPDEENRSVDCIYTQVKRKRKEHRSLDSILFEDDSDELEYFDVLNLLPLSNVRLEVDELDKTNNNVIQERSGKELSNQESKSNPTIISVSSKKSNDEGEKYFKHHSKAQITEIDEIVSIKSNTVENTKNRGNTDILDLSSKKSVVDKGITSFSEIAREKRHSENVAYLYDSNLDLHKKKDNLQTNTVVESCHLKSKQKDSKRKEDLEIAGNKKDTLNLHFNKNHTVKEKPKVEETEDTKSLWISDNEEIEEMSRRPQVLKIIDNDVTKPKNLKNSVSIDVKSVEDSIMFKENICENTTTNYHTFRISNKPDLINDHIHETKANMDNSESNKDKKRSSVENAKSFFENKGTDKEQLTNRQSEGRFERIVKETSNILGKACNAVKGSLGFEARSESSDLGLGSEIGSDARRSSMDENTNTIEGKVNNQKSENDGVKQFDEVDGKNKKNYTNLTRSRSCIDSIESQDSDEPEFDHVRYKILKSNIFSKNIFNNSKKDVSYEGLMQYFREYSFQDLLMDNNVVIIEPVRAEVERKPSFNDSKTKSSSSNKVSTNSLEKIKISDSSSSDKNNESKVQNHFKAPRQSSLRKHFFYQPIRVNRELNDDELPDPDTVRNVRKMFEETMKEKLKPNSEIARDCNARKSVSMKDLRTIENRTFERGTDKVSDAPRSRCSSRAKDLTKMFENMDKTSAPTSIISNKDEVDCPRNESKARSIAQSFEARSGLSSPSNSNSSKSRVNRYNQRQFHNWDAGSVSSGVSSDYPDTDAGSAPPCTSSEDEELYCQEDDGVDERYEGHYVSQDVLKKIRECGTSVTYYGGKVVNTYNGPLICPMVCKKSKGSKKSLDYIKFRLVKSNSCDSRLELTGRVVNNDNNNQSKCGINGKKDKSIDLRQFTIDETPSIEIMLIEKNENDELNEKTEAKEEKREPPVVIGLEPKKEEKKTFKADFKLGKLEDCSSINRFALSALTRWQINENTWKRTSDFGKMEFEEFEVLEDSLNGVDN